MKSGEIVGKVGGGWVDSVYHEEAYILQHRDIESSKA